MDFLNFIKESKTMYHACNTISKILDDNNFIKLNENEKFNLELGKNYYFTRNNSSVIAFKLPKKLDDLSFNISAAHLDSPTFKLKPNFEIDLNRYQMLNTEVYGGPIYSTFMDRPLDIAGRVLIKDNNKIITKLFSFDKPVCMIPNLCIHFNRNANTEMNLNPQKDMLPLFMDKEISKYDLKELISNKLNCKKEDIYGYDLFLSLIDRGTYVGFNNEFIMAPQIDNLECSYVSVMSLIKSKIKDGTIDILALFDNEEIGSHTRQGAQSDMVLNTLRRITDSFNLSNEEHLCAINNSFFVSLDNAQGFHPNYPDKYDSTNRCYLNEGIVIKNAASGSYTTDGLSLSIFKEICEKANAKYQFTTNRSDIRGGSTLGAILLSKISIPAVDIGLAQLSMHSAYETCGSLDIDELMKAMIKYNETHFHFNGDKEVELK